MQYFLSVNFDEGIAAIAELLNTYGPHEYEKVVECCGILTNLLENDEAEAGFSTPKKAFIGEMIEESTANSSKYEENFEIENFEGETLGKFF